jgi:hypothetical protein
MIAYGGGDYDKATDLLWPRRHDIVKIGGSNAQRDLFAQIICDAAVHSSQRHVARSLLSERVLSRRTRKRNWQLYSELLAELGETERAAAAQRQGEMAQETGA